MKCMTCHGSRTRCVRVDGMIVPGQPGISVSVAQIIQHGPAVTLLHCFILLYRFCRLLSSLRTVCSKVCLGVSGAVVGFIVSFSLAVPAAGGSAADSNAVLYSGYSQSTLGKSGPT